jgi:GT2 family glycosyltransferase
VSENAGVTAVIPVYNRADLLRRMLETAAAQTLPFEEIIVIDNASTDNAAQVAAAFGCRVIRNSTNAGFARAVNAGWQAAATEWVAVLNSDVELDPDWLARLVGYAARMNAGFATGLIMDAASRERGRTLIDGTYDLVSRAGCAWRVAHGHTTAPQSPARIAIAPGTACLFRRSVLEQLGGYEESFESYLEDVDLGLRCVQHGISGVFVPSSIAWHHGSATLGRWNPRVVRLISRNQLLLIARNYDATLFRRCLWRILVGQMLWGGVAARHGAFVAWALGKLDGLRNFRLKGYPSAQLEAFLESSEREIRQLTDDSYWRWYFRLTAFLFTLGRSGAH